MVQGKNPCPKLSCSLTFIECPMMTRHPYHQHPSEFSSLVGATVRQTGTTQDGFPYLVLDQPHGNRRIYLIVQADAPGNSPGYLHLTEHPRTA